MKTMGQTAGVLRSVRTRMVTGGMLGLAVAALVAAGFVSASSATTSGVGVIGFSLGPALNTWHQVELSSWTKVAGQLKQQGKISGLKVLQANGSVSTQVSQIDDLILEHVSAIAIDPNSPTGLNSAIAKANAAHIPVVVFSDGPVTSSVPHELEFNMPPMMKSEVAYLCTRLHGHGNIINVRGIAGLSAEAALNDGTLAGVKACPGLHVVGTIYGSWDDSTTESKLAALLPSISQKINGVVNQGGAYGAFQAFQAAGLPVPAQPLDNRLTALKWWAAEHTKNGYTTMSMSTNPGIGGAAAYMAADLAAKKLVPKCMIMPTLKITQATLSQYIGSKAPAVAGHVYNYSWVQSNLLKKPSTLSVVCGGS
jgi:ribose transport system substrate-binding protein